MLTNIAKNIIIRALEIRMSNGENINEILNSYINLSDEEKKEILQNVIESE